MCVRVYKYKKKCINIYTRKGQREKKSEKVNAYYFIKSF